MRKSKSSLVKKSNAQHKRLWVVFAVFAILVVLAAVSAFVIYKKRSQQIQTPTEPNVGETIIYTPATKQEKESVDAHKQAIVEQQQGSGQTQTDSDGRTQVKLTIVNADSQGVTGYIGGIFEQGGTCTATATRGDQKITKSSTGFQNASYTQCAPIQWDAPLSSGAWVVTLTYSSTAATGSAQRTIEVQ